MTTFDLPLGIQDMEAHRRTVKRFRDQGIVLPTFSELADPTTIPDSIRQRLVDVDPDSPHPLNLFRVHWYNAADRREQVSVPGHLVLPPSLTGVRAPIFVALGERFPLIGAHKVLAAYACLVPRLAAGAFDPERHRAVWPSTGNYCRGGVAISKILGCRGVAVLPEGMSAERFAWLERWVARPEDIIRTPGTESNVKEIYDTCHALAADPQNFILNQFSEFANHLAHWRVTGPALGRIYESWSQNHPDRRLAAFVSATGSAGTIGAGDFLAETYGSKTVAVEALECPTMLENGFGAHNIQGIGDKHIPLIHNVMATDFAVAVSDAATDRLHALFQSVVGRSYLADRRGVPAALLAQLGSLGLSGIANVLGAIKVAKYLDLGPDDAIVTIATDGAAMYSSEIDKIIARLPHGLDTVAAGEIYGQYVAAATVDHVLELDHTTRNRIFNLGYYTWVEQQGVSIERFEARRKQTYWRSLRAALSVWDHLIGDLDDEVRSRP
ncbi:MAG: pyridoxal-phosphate dependent enzyme [Myxococcota bacterium]